MIRAAARHRFTHPPITMVTFLSFTDAGGRIGRIQWTNAASSGQAITWGTVKWDSMWPATPDQLATMLRRCAEAAEALGRQMALAVAPVVKAAEAISAFGKAFGTVALTMEQRFPRAGVITSPARPPRAPWPRRPRARRR
jgi:hypothetical protein